MTEDVLVLFPSHFFNGGDFRSVGQEGQFLPVGFLHPLLMDMQVKNKFKYKFKCITKSKVKFKSSNAIFSKIQI